MSQALSSKLANTARPTLLALIGFATVESAAAQLAVTVKDDAANAVTFITDPFPQPTARITTQVFDDNPSINGAYDQPAGHTLAPMAARGAVIRDASHLEQLRPSIGVEQSHPRRPGTIIVPPRPAIPAAEPTPGATVLELAPAPAPSNLYDGLAESQALHFESTGDTSGTCLYWSKPRYVGKTPTYEFTMLACTWDHQGALVEAVPCPEEGCERFQSSSVVAPPGVVLAAENSYGTAVGWRFTWAGSSPYAIWADVQAIEVVNGVQTDLLAPNWQLRYAFDVDESGNIIGYGRLNGHDRGFLMLRKNP